MIFARIDKELKTLAKIIFWIGISVGLVYLVISLINFIDNYEYIKYATASYDNLIESGDLAYLGSRGIGMSIAILIGSIVSSFLIYGVGELITNSFKMIENKNISEKIENPPINEDLPQI